jgi:RNA-directed DNA polymerase
VTSIAVEYSSHWFDMFHRADGQRGPTKLVRYADDFVVLARYQSRKLAEFIESKLEQWMSLELNREKTRVVHVRQAEGSLTF